MVLLIFVSYIGVYIKEYRTTLLLQEKLLCSVLARRRPCDMLARCMLAWGVSRCMIMSIRKGLYTHKVYRVRHPRENHAREYHSRLLLAGIIPIPLSEND